jgi:colanic acid biosynthesis glycosyl transferase WcaI
MPRLLCIYQHAPTPGGPGFYRHRHYLGELARRGWAVDLVSCPVDYLTGATPERYARRLYTGETIDGIRHHWMWGAGSIHRSRLNRVLNYVSFAATATGRSLSLPRPDVIWASSPPLPLGGVGALAARRYRRPWLFEIRDLWPESAAAVGWLGSSGGLYRLLERVAHRYASGAWSVIVPTPGLEPFAYAHGARQVDVLPGIVLDTQQPAHVRERVRAEVAAGDACLVAYVGALGVANGLDTLLDAAKELVGERRLAFVVAGAGSDRERVEQRIARERIPNIRLLGPVPKERVKEILAASDVVLHLLRNEPIFRTALPNKVLDAFSAHRPFVTTVDGLPRELADASGGGYAPSVAALATELRSWAAMSPEERTVRGERSFEYGQSRFGLPPSVDRLESILLRTMRS